MEEGQDWTRDRQGREGSAIIIIFEASRDHLLARLGIKTFWMGPANPILSLIPM